MPDSLYEDAGIVGSVLDTGLPRNDPLIDLIPGKVMRLFQMDPLIEKLIEQTDSYKELLREYQASLDLAVKKDGFVGIKCHLAEQVGFGVESVSDGEAEAILSRLPKPRILKPSRSSMQRSSPAPFSSARS